MYCNRQRPTSISSFASTVNQKQPLYFSKRTFVEVFWSEAWRKGKGSFQGSPIALAKHLHWVNPYRESYFFNLCDNTESIALKKFIIPEIYINETILLRRLGKQKTRWNKKKKRARLQTINVPLKKKASYCSSIQFFNLCQLNGPPFDWFENLNRLNPVLATCHLGECSPARVLTKCKCLRFKVAPVAHVWGMFVCIESQLIFMCVKVCPDHYKSRYRRATPMNVKSG